MILLSAPFLCAEKYNLSLPAILVIMKKAITEALRVISRILKGRDLEWVLVGSTSLALQGVKVYPKDVDVLTGKDEAYEIAELLREYEVYPVSFKRSELFASHFGKFNVGGVLVEVMGDLETFIDGRWTNVTADRLRLKRLCRVGDLEVPVSSLEQQLESYEKLNRKKDARTIEAIRDALRKQA